MASPKPDVPSICSDQLDLVSMSQAFIEASLEGRHSEAEAIIGGRLTVSWPEDRVRRTLTWRLEQMAADPVSAPWLLRAMLRRRDRVVVGYINFHQPPNDQGQVELGYTVFEDYRRQGYATEAALALMGWARKQHGVQRFIVSISPANQPSLAMAAKLGFIQIGTQIDEIDGKEYVFELKVAGSRPERGRGPRGQDTSG